MGGGAPSGRWRAATRMFARPQARFTAEHAEHAEAGLAMRFARSVQILFSARSACSAVNLAVFRFVPGTARLVS